MAYGFEEIRRASTTAVLRADVGKRVARTVGDVAAVDILHGLVLCFGDKLGPSTSIMA